MHVSNLTRYIPQYLSQMFVFRPKLFTNCDPIPDPLIVIFRPVSPEKGLYLFRVPFVSQTKNVLFICLVDGRNSGYKQ
jgi:hypothetical protein